MSSPEFDKKFQELKAEAHRRGMSTRDLIKRRHLEALKFARDNGSRYAHIAIDALEEEMSDDREND